MAYNTSKVSNGINYSKQLIDKNYTKGIFITPKYIVIHDTNNRDFGANAKFIRDFISVNTRIKSSAHYIVDDKNIIQALEDTWRGWHVSDSSNKYITNSNSIAIELCVNRGNNFNATLNNALFLIKKLMKKYNIPEQNVVRHYDVTKKNCPKIMMVDNIAIWPEFRQALKYDLDNVNIIEPIFKGKILDVLTALNIKEEASKESDVIGQIFAKEEFFVYEEIDTWYKIVHELEYDTVFAFINKGYVEKIDLNEPKRKIKERINREVQNKLEKEEREVLERTSIIVPEPKYDPPVRKNILQETLEEKQDLLKPKDVTKMIIEKKNATDTSLSNREGKVVGVLTNLAVRKGPDFSYYAIGYILEGQIVTILEEYNKWYKIRYNSSRGSREGYVKEENIEIQ